MELKKILITGASSDIGYKLTEKLLKNNYKVVGTYNTNKKKLIKLKEEFKDLDIIKINFEKKDLQKIKLNNIDCFISLHGYVKKNKKKLNEIEFQKHLKINYFTNLIIIEKLLNEMKKKKFGRIYLTSSVGTKYGGSEETLYYSLSKYLNEFHPNYLRKLIKFNITLNTIMIGVVDTKFHKKIKNKNMSERIKLTPFKKLITIDQMSDSIYNVITNKDNLFINTLINLTNGE
tara:strand:- start:201 stop:896 length:696 start_codon:yes stop_codon:yes gene_type:complete